MSIPSLVWLFPVNEKPIRLAFGKLMNHPTLSKTPLSLILDTTSSHLSIALAQGTTIKTEWGIITTKPTASQVLMDIDYVLKRSEVLPSQLSSLGALIGPGSFTGLRIGLATIQGLGQALGLPVVTATTLEVIADVVPQSVEPVQICVIQPAHREEVFAQVFRRSPGKAMIAVTPPRTGPKQSLIPELLHLMDHEPAQETGVIFTGEAVPALETLLQVEANQRGVPYQTSQALKSDMLPKGWQFKASPPFLAMAAVELLYQRWCDGLSQPPESVHPCYVRLSEVTIKPKKSTLSIQNSTEH